MIRERVVDGVKWYHLGDVVKLQGVQNPRQIAQRIRVTHPEHITKMRALDARNQNRLTAWVTKTAVDNIRARSNKQRTRAGEVYAFTPIGADNIVKVGRTQNWAKRTYTGLNKPKHVILVRHVEDMFATEKTMIQGLMAHKEFTHRCDLGNEWFETSLSIGDIKKTVCLLLQ